MTRKELQLIARIRVRDARVLLANQQFSAAYYLAGYAVECGIKSCIAKTVQKHSFPDKRFAQDAYTHDLEKLLKVANLYDQFHEDLQSNTNLSTNWNIVKDWNESKRYDANGNRQNAEDLLRAITTRNGGILSWLRTRW